MNRTRSEHAETLPRIKSQGKFARAVTQLGERPREEDPAKSEEKRALTRLSSDRRNLQSANISKAVRYEATNAIYLRKIETLEKQSFLLDKEIATANQQISALRIKKKTNDESRTASSKVSQISKRSQFANETNTSRLQALRKKVDKENEKNRQIQKDIDCVRREINTTKRLNEQLEEDLKAITKRLDAETKTACKLDEEIGTKRQEVKKKKIDLIHQKTHLIKNYDLILKKLDQDLASAPVTESRAINTNLYLTDVYITSTTNRKNKQFTENSPKSKKTAVQMNYLKEKIEQCEQHFQQLRQATGCGSIEEAISKFSQGYEQNFSKYRYLNERFAHLQDLKQKNAALNKKREQLQETLTACKTSRSACGLLKIQDKMSEVHNQKDEIKAKITHNEQLYAILKSFAVDAMHKIPLQRLREKYQIDQLTDFSAIINKDNLQEFLDQILAVKQMISRRSTKQTSLGRSQAKGSLEECLQQARKEGMQEKERFLGRQELMQVQHRPMARSKAIRH